jgi:hypothetical protein
VAFERFYQRTTRERGGALIAPCATSIRSGNGVLTTAQSWRDVIANLPRPETSTRKPRIRKNGQFINTINLLRRRAV